MEREQLIKEIQQTAEKIKNDSYNSNELIADAALLYEKVILLKHLPVTESPLIQQQTTPKAAIQKEEVKTQDKNQSSIDLFSHTTPLPEVPTEQEKKKIETPKTSENISNKVQNKKPTDLKSIIGINEKFQFINELFDGNMKEYTVALDQINNFSSKQEADSYLSNLKEMYKWPTDNEVANNFKEIVKRLFV